MYIIIKGKKKKTKSVDKEMKNAYYPQLMDKHSGVIDSN